MLQTGSEQIGRAQKQATKYREGRSGGIGIGVVHAAAMISQYSLRRIPPIQYNMVEKVQYVFFSHLAMAILCYAYIPVQFTPSPKNDSYQPHESCASQFPHPTT